jgi:hypothetical protein
MKISSIIAEQEKTNEGPLRNIMPAFTKTQKLRKAAGKAAAGATKDEIRQMEVELLTYMEYSGQKRATPDVLKNYFKQKGLGNVGTSVVDAFVASKRPAAPPSDAAGAGAAGLGGNPPANPPASSGPTPPTGNPPPAPPTALPRGTKAKLASGEEFTWQGAQWKSNQTGRVASKAQKQELNQAAGMQTNSMYEAADPNALTKGEVRKIIQQVVQKAYGGAAGFSQSRFAEPGQASAAGPSGGSAGGAGLPDSITNAVSGLTPAQKAALKAML